jgi:hypothetical protein
MLGPELNITVAFLGYSITLVKPYHLGGKTMASGAAMPAAGQICGE